MSRDLNIVILSKDRACQVLSLLQSLRDHFNAPCTGITVLYRATSPAFAAGYELARGETAADGLRWQQEQSFRGDVAALCSRLDDEALAMFLVDDDIVHREAPLGGVLGAFTKNHLFVSLRASRAYGCDTPPEFIVADPYLEWKWNYSKRKPVTWNYPFSIDGNIFHAAHIKKIIREISFAAPNSLEGRMHAYRHRWWVKRIKKALAPLDAVVFNNPLNRVQAEGETWNAGVSPDEINRAFLGGMRIDNPRLYAARPTATHFDAGLHFVKPAG
jgi:hypothetical protein